jgi:two-component system chemotaxis response regulator CheB
MAVRVLVVDDSGFFRRRVTEMLEADNEINVIGAAENGKIAVEKVKELRPDVVTMDIEMPEMDGITATREIMKSRPTRIIMFSSLTTDGAKATLDALDAGALDFLPKRFEDISSDREEAKKLLCERVKQLVRQPINLQPIPARKVSPTSTPTQRRVQTTATVKQSPAKATATAHIRHGGIDLVAIGTSTGGPVALQEVLTKIPADFPVPIIIVQHMPGTFTPAFAQRLNDMCAITVKEAADGDQLHSGYAYLAPGGKQMLVEGSADKPQIRVLDAEQNQTYKPSVDITFSSVAKVFPGKTLAVILTGMGADGREGSRELKEGGSIVWAQDKASCVVYGMPCAVTEAGLSERELSLTDVGLSIVQRV